MTNEQSLINLRNNINYQKHEYMTYLRLIIKRKNNNISILEKELLKCQQLGNVYFNSLEDYVSTSDLLGAHKNGKFITGLAEDCESVLNAVIAHIKFLKSYPDILSSDLVKPSKNAYANMQRMVKKYLPEEQWKELYEKFKTNELPTTGFEHQGEPNMNQTPKWQLIAGLAIGVLFASIVLGLAVMIPNPTGSQFFIFRGTFAMALAGIAAIIPGLLDVESRYNKFSIKATGAIAVFVLVWLLNPPAIIGDTNKLENENNTTIQKEK